MCRLYTLFAFLLGFYFCPAQNTTTIRGKVIDMESQVPLVGITVFINSTTMSTQTDKDGNFVLNNISFPIFELTFSAVNYEIKMITIDIKKEIKPINIALKKSTETLDEVVVTTRANKNDWSIHGSTFKKDFLGYSSFAKKCEILNYNDIKFRSIKNRNLLKAYSKIPITIQNKALGYELHYWLEDYEHQFSQKLVSFKGYVQFSELTGSKKQHAQWKKNRNTAYYGSLTHFLKSLYDGKTTEEGFIVNAIKIIPFGNLNFYIPSRSDTIPHAQFLQKFTTDYNHPHDAALTKALYTKAFYWINNQQNISPFSYSIQNTDQSYSVYFFEKSSTKKEQVLVYLFNVNNVSDIQQIQWQTAGTIIPDQKEINKIIGLHQLTQAQKSEQKISLFYTISLNPSNFLTKKDGNVYLQFQDSWQVTYTKEVQEPAYINEQTLDKENASYQSSILSMTNAAIPIRILANGYYPQTFGLITGAYWTYEKIDKMLPINFKPY